MKIYILGDSFTDNLFKYEIDAIENNQPRSDENPIYQYVKFLKNQNLPYPLHFGDYLKLWGHEIINLGKGGCSNNSIYHQFTQIKEPFDRIIINWTGLARFDWYFPKSNFRTFTGGFGVGTKLTPFDEFLLEQGHNRQFNKTLSSETIDFISFFVDTYKEKKPIIWSPFIRDEIKNLKGFFWHVKDDYFKDIIPEWSKLEIFNEVNGKINDSHYGRYGNFYTALIFNTILEHTKDNEHDGYYIKDSILISKIIENIKTAQHNIIEINHSI